MDWLNRDDRPAAHPPYRDDRVGAHPPYRTGDRCPVCLVPLMAPHLNSCDYDGVWWGELPAADDGDADDDASDED